jgi:hypothetical protein
MIEKIMVVAPTTAVPISLERVTGAIVLFEVVFGPLEVRVHTPRAMQFVLDAGNLFDHRQLVDRLRVVGDWTVRVHRDRDRTHPQKAERNQPERKDRWSEHSHVGEAEGADAVRRRHQSDDADAEPERGEIARHQPRENVQRRPALPR